MFFMYILKSKKNGKYYIGATHCLEVRLKQHNAGKIRSTKGLVPLEIVYSENYATNSEARKRESYVKRRKSRKFIDALMKKRILTE